MLASADACRFLLLLPLMKWGVLSLWGEMERGGRSAHAATCGVPVPLAGEEVPPSISVLLILLQAVMLCWRAHLRNCNACMLSLTSAHSPDARQYPPPAARLSHIHDYPRPPPAQNLGHAPARLRYVLLQDQQARV